MSPTVPIALFGWWIVVAVFFGTMRPTLAMAASLVGAYLLLPSIVWNIGGIPLWSKFSAGSTFTLLGALIFAPGATRSWQRHPIDAIVLVGGVCWGLSSLVNDRGIGQAVADWWFFASLIGIPYVLGRWFLRSPRDLRDLAIVIVSATCLYGILMLIEMRTFPRMNLWVYGWMLQRGSEVSRMGGYRSMVFLPNGLATSIWVCATLTLAWALALGGVVRTILRIRTSIVAVALIVLSLLTRSAGAMAIGAVCFGALLVAWRTHFRQTPLLIAGGIVAYLVTGVLESSLPIRSLAIDLAEWIYPERAFSLKVRFDCEQVLTDRALSRPILGWGGWGEWRDLETAVVREVVGKDDVVTDGFWVIVLGQRGLVGVATVYGIMLLPAVLSLRWSLRRRCEAPDRLLIAALGLWNLAIAADLLLNGFVNPVTFAISGGLASLLTIRARERVPIGRRGGAPSEAAILPRSPLRSSGA